MTDWVLGSSTPSVVSTRSGILNDAGSPGQMLGLPTRSTEVSGTLDSALGIETVYRAMDIITTNVSQLRLKTIKAGQPIRNRLVERPNVDDSLSKFLKRTTIGLAGTGNAYWLITRDRDTNVVVNLEVLNPNAVQITYDTNDNKQYTYGDKVYTRDQVKHLRKLEIPGSAYGLGPIQAGRHTIAGVQDVKDYGNNWFRDAGIPNGVLSTDQELDPETATYFKNQWMLAQTNHQVAVVGKGLKYATTILSPSDALWVDAQKFGVQQVARMFGIPATWLLAEVGGNSMTYNNQETVYMEFIRNTLNAYLVEIEDALTDLTPNGSTVKFDIDGFLRPDSKTRAEIQVMYHTAGILTANEIRDLEGYQPLTAAQKRDLKPAPLPAPQETPND